MLGTSVCGTSLHVFAVPVLYTGVELGAGDFRFGGVVLCLRRGIAVFRGVFWMGVRASGTLVGWCWNAGLRVSGRCGRT